MDCGRVANEISEWISGHLAKAACSRAVMGVSGGVDSAVAAVLTKRGCPDGALALVLPMGKSDEVPTERAIGLCEQFEIPWRLVAIGPIVDLCAQWLPPEVSDQGAERVRPALGNLRPRVRMTLLYLYANALGALVVGTGNKSELEVGYFTKYGDAGVDIEPLGGLYKHEVTALARFLDVPGDIIETPPSAGLWEGQTDEGEMGVSYEQIETYLRSRDTAREPDLPADLSERITRMVSTSEHKRRTPATFEQVRELID